jgi:hypothetical protein
MLKCYLERSAPEVLFEIPPELLIYRTSYLVNSAGSFKIDRNLKSVPEAFSYAVSLI